MSVLCPMSCDGNRFKNHSIQATSTFQSPWILTSILYNVSIYRLWSWWLHPYYHSSCPLEYNPSRKTHFYFGFINFSLNVFPQGTIYIVICNGIWFLVIIDTQFLIFLQSLGNYLLAKIPSIPIPKYFFPLNNYLVLIMLC